MKLRYKSTGKETYGHKFNMHALSEVLTGDDSVFIRNLDVLLKSTGEWKDLHQAFTDHDVITDNLNSVFFEPTNEEDRKRGYKL